MQYKKLSNPIANVRKETNFICKMVDAPGYIFVY